MDTKSRRPTIKLGYKFGHFISFHELLANRLQDHSTFGNLVCHLIAGPMLGFASFSLLLSLSNLPGVVLSLNAILCLLSLVTDLPYGVCYVIYAATSSYYQLMYADVITVPVSLIIIAVASVLQLGIGHMLLEKRPPNELEGIVKGDSRLFSVVDLVWELSFSVFHFYAILALKMGLRPSLRHAVETELKRLNHIINNKA